MTDRKTERVTDRQAQTTDSDGQMDEKQSQTGRKTDGTNLVISRERQRDREIERD